MRRGKLNTISIKLVVLIAFFSVFSVKIPVLSLLSIPSFGTQTQIPEIAISSIDKNVTRNSPGRLTPSNF